MHAPRLYTTSTFSFHGPTQNQTPIKRDHIEDNIEALTILIRPSRAHLGPDAALLAILPGIRVFDVVGGLASYDVMQPFSSLSMRRCAGRSTDGAGET